MVKARQEMSSTMQSSPIDWASSKRQSLSTLAVQDQAQDLRLMAWLDGEGNLGCRSQNHRGEIITEMAEGSRGMSRGAVGMLTRVKGRHNRGLELLGERGEAVDRTHNHRKSLIMLLL